MPLPLPTSFGGKDNYIDQLAVQMASKPIPQDAVLPRRSLEAMAAAAAERQGCEGIEPGKAFARPPRPKCAANRAGADDAICYLQYSSGSTRFPHGVAVTHRSLLNNLAGHGHGDAAAGPATAASRWLPWYHDMGLVGCFLSPIANQVLGRLPQDRGFRAAARWPGSI